MPSTRTSQVNGSANGWAFQVNAGIWLMLENIKKIKHLKMEGEKEDIEITFSDGKKVYAQAKSISQIGDNRHTKEYLQDALSSLSKIDDGESKLIYISNIENPLKSQTGNALIYNGIYTFDILSDTDKQTIRSMVDNSFNINNLEIRVLNFFGDGMARFEPLKEKIKEFLQDANVDISNAKKILYSWVTEFITNCTDKKLPLKKSDVVYPIIVVLIDKPISEDDFQKTCDYDNYDEIRTKYGLFITQKTCDYQFISRITGDFTLKKDECKSKEDYIDTYWQTYEDDYKEIETDVKAREALIKFMLLTVLRQKSDISKIKEAVNL